MTADKPREIRADGFTAIAQTGGTPGSLAHGQAAFDVTATGDSFADATRIAFSASAIRSASSRPAFAATEHIAGTAVFVLPLKPIIEIVVAVQRSLEVPAY
ncbi:hypothetical protein [Scleromatobacter humisilvae]|uniref:GrpB family protein n=1 Tax=Scleromatobacter humisilvae TaxID=2897159 RepID=A0A9X2C056_9BURK|nr:hypothetical protein [Scleromatobacter humisilvae]MCK9686987.1 GrpB family protein [Scleromatobacter humisilvae]